MCDSPFCTECFYNTAFTVVNSYVTFVTNHIPSFGIFQPVNCFPFGTPSGRRCISASRYTAVFQYLVYKMRTINAICQGISAVNIWISDKLIGIVNDFLAKFFLGFRFFLLLFGFLFCLSFFFCFDLFAGFFYLFLKIFSIVLGF